jgi:hypothetical protein
MTDLSFAAQAVRDAAFHSVAHDKAHTLEARVAAALRAAADQVQFEGQLGMTAYGGHAQAQSQLLAIADELEGSHD